ncbi:Hypothetical protein (part of ICE) [Mycoplasma mycoides subsp. capri LC str. 95010]|uniref:Uncharacterized protein n=2 Tax=Mycoplasma mycoides subsp. capri LC str. 95010 TaxID=862259 RepID=F4MPK1_MYCML|nr:hypothetical protein [Mycoplasma mycoides]CBW54033.1 Hypothetical protein (part of ICE) [Mycoplasma mycoides subsp. capri LC str. 95010]
MKKINYLLQIPSNTQRLLESTKDWLSDNFFDNCMNSLEMEEYLRRVYEFKTVGEFEKFDELGQLIEEQQIGTDCDFIFIDKDDQELKIIDFSLANYIFFADILAELAKEMQEQKEDILKARESKIKLNLIDKKLLKLMNKN